MEYQPYSAQTTKDLRDLAERRGAGTILELTPEELRRSASRWTYRHLIAYRLLTQPEQASLPILASTHDQCPQCNEQSPVQSINRVWTDHLTGDTPQRLTTRTESELAALPGGFFWVALARAARRGPAREDHAYGTRPQTSGPAGLCKFYTCHRRLFITPGAPLVLRIRGQLQRHRRCQ